MKLETLKDKSIRPLRDLIAFKWIKPKLESGIIIPDSIYDLKLRKGRFYVGKILAVGPKTYQLKIGDLIMVHEYGIKDFKGTWKEDEIYFIEESNCEIKINDPADFKSLLDRPESKNEAEIIENL